MKVLVLGGTGVISRDIAKLLIQTGHEVTLFGLEGTRLWKELAGEGVKCVGWGTAAGSSDRRGESERRVVDLDSLTITDSIGLQIGGSNRIRIAYWAEDRMVYCAMATLASLPGVESPAITEERSCSGVELLAVDSVRFENGVVTTPAQLREQTALRVEATSSSTGRVIDC